MCFAKCSFLRRSAGGSGPSRLRPSRGYKKGRCDPFPTPSSPKPRPITRVEVRHYSPSDLILCHYSPQSPPITPMLRHYSVRLVITRPPPEARHHSLFFATTLYDTPFTRRPPLFLPPNPRTTTLAPQGKPLFPPHAHAYPYHNLRPFVQARLNFLPLFDVTENEEHA